MAHGHPDFQPISTPTLPDFGEGQEAWFQSETIEVGANSDVNLINYVVPDSMELRICSGIVSCKAPRTQKFKFITTPVGDWISPIGYIDVDHRWDNEELAYDGNVGTYAEVPTLAESWSRYLEFLVNEANIDKIKFYGLCFPEVGDLVKIIVYYGGEWHDVYEGLYASLEWVEKDIAEDAQLVSKARIQLYNPSASMRRLELNEFMFNTAKPTPQEVIFFDTYAIIPYLPEAPYPVPSGATFILKVYNDDDDKQWMSVNLAGFLQKKV